MPVAWDWELILKKYFATSNRYPHLVLTAKPTHSNIALFSAGKGKRFMDRTEYASGAVLSSSNPVLRLIRHQQPILPALPVAVNITSPPATTMKASIRSENQIYALERA
jgi:hypothetical protein